MKKIAVVSVSRSDYGIYRPILCRIQRSELLDLQLIVAGMHLSPVFGMTVNEIERDGFPIAERVEMLVASDTPEAISLSMGLGVLGFARVFSKLKPDTIVVLGDRFEMHSAAVAAVPFGIPVSHIHGGEVTVGAFDDALRHSITKLSHLHFVATAEYGRRVEQLGEEHWRITIAGAPGLDNLKYLELPSRNELEAKYGLELYPKPLLVTYHPVTLDYANTQRHVTELMQALHEVKLPVIFTMPNADTCGHIVRQAIVEYIRDHPNARVIENLGTAAYFALMSQVAAMVGNSSSGIIEAASFRLPVVNVGARQEGRVRARNVIDVGNEWRQIQAGIYKAISTQFQQSLTELMNPYCCGNASETIVSRLETEQLDAPSLVIKRFRDLCVQAA